MISDAIIAVSVLLGLSYFALTWKRPKYPPGPKGRYPLLGLTFDMPKERPWETYAEWARKYGPIIYFRTGLKHNIMINDATVYRELLSQRSTIYNSRAPSEVGEIVSGGRRSVQMPYGDQWRRVRRLFSNVLTEAKCNEYLKYQEAEATYTINNMLHEPRGFVEELHRYSLSVARTVAFGKRVPSSTSEFSNEVREVMENFSRASSPGRYLLETLPFLRLLPRAFQPWLAELEKYQKLEAEVCMKNYRDAVNEAEIDPSKPSFSQSIRKEMEKTGEVDDVQAASSSMEILGAGSETTATVLQFIILALVTNPEVVQKAHEELDRVIGQDRFPVWDDEPRLPYVRAIIKEAQRWRGISPTSVPHYTSKDDVYRGYYIPKNTIVRINHWLIHNDPTRYPNPEKFCPERFINHKSSASASANSSNPSDRDHFSYGGGKRICPGIHLAERSLFTVTSRMLHAFEFERAIDPKTGRPQDFTAEDVGVSTTLIMAPGKPFEVDFKIRSEQIATSLKEELQAQSGYLSET